MELFEVDDYRDAIRLIIEDRKKSDKDLTYQYVAQFCRIQKGYLSRVVQKKAELSRDQLFLFCESVYLEQEKRNYLFLLHDHNRCYVQKRKVSLEKELHQIRKKHGKTENYIRPAQLVTDELSQFSKYYLDTDTQLVHMFLTIERFRQNLTLLAEVLGFHSHNLQRHLTRLEELRLIELKNGVVHILQDELHLSSDHPIFPVYRTIMRVRSLAKLQQPNDSDNYYYSAIFSAPSNARSYIKKKFLAFLQEIQGKLIAGGSEDVFQINFDIFKWS